MKKQHFFIIFQLFLTNSLSAETESELLKLESLSRSESTLAIAQSILQAYPESEKSTITDIFQKSKTTESSFFKEHFLQ
ncbi:hypothetical protein COB28_02905 [Candidatus Dependentiae bacterium]|nr:MAG: hypothetical protein COB28_02905 [Candidatus Dependentiae bacterium]